MTPRTGFHPDTSCPREFQCEFALKESMDPKELYHYLYIKAVKQTVVSHCCVDGGIRLRLGRGKSIEINLVDTLEESRYLHCKCTIRYFTFYPNSHTRTEAEIYLQYFWRLILQFSRTKSVFE